MTTRLKTFAHRKSKSRRDAPNFGFSSSELRTLRALKTPAGIQRFLDHLPYNLSFTARSLRNSAHLAAHVTDGKAAYASRSTHIQRRNDRSQKKQNLIAKARTIISILGDAKNVARAIFQVN